MMRSAMTGVAHVNRRVYWIITTALSDTDNSAGRAITLRT